ncbi:MAG: hypothetical protein KIT02_04240 [Devosia sp.]|uniref:hypothetical protein n=1 Tax=Devosia sp. TaxID=1871048 RepID=UPI0024C75FB2|nr:hypothetical protein [Devosia sp.]UYO00433.1 MAG: hypothetical protein KIT02_04240 [Devosia sp.]
MTHERAFDGSALKVLAGIEALGREHGLTFILDSGTLLGLVRGGQLIAGDLDVDVSVVDVAAFKALVRKSDAGRVWRFAGQPYKLELPLPGVGHTLDVKLFRRSGQGWISPAVGAATTSEGGRGGARRLLRPLWRLALRHGDAARFPMNMVSRTDAWVVPAAYFDQAALLEGFSHCAMPADPEAYLAYRYGSDWQVPRANWVSWRDDGGYARDQGRALREAAGS